MNQVLESPSCDEVDFEPDTPTSADAVKVSSAATDSADEQGSSPSGDTTVKKGRVLVLEDDSALCETIRVYLAENGYPVVAVRSGGEGVREVLAGDFAMILCNFMMPGLPGDKFYHAVEKIRPSLCRGFVFMIDPKSDTRAIEFIKSVYGFVLQKPFPLANLLDALVLADVRRNSKSIFDSPGELDASQSSEPTGRLALHESPVRQEPAINQTSELDPSIPPPASAPTVAASDVAPGPAPIILPPEASTASPDAASGKELLFWVLGFLFILIAGLWNRYSDAWNGATDASAQRLARQVEWSAVSSDLEAALAKSAKLDAAKAQAALISAERAKPRLTSALRSSIPTGDFRIDILDIAARSDIEDSRPGELRIHGIARGPDSRGEANLYRQSVENQLNRSAYGPVASVRFEEPKEPLNEPADLQQAPFVIIAPLAPAEPSAAQKEGR